MADSPSRPDTDRDAGATPGAEPTAGTPRWVKVFALIALVVVVLVVVVTLIGGGRHRPGQHTSPGRDGGDRTPPSSAQEGHTPPEGGHR